ncbi:MAG: polysaccharide deacetylase family protein [bacterium]
MKTKIFILLLGVGFSLCSHQVAITFDDLPIAYPGHLSPEVQVKYFNHILYVLDQHEIGVTGFVVGMNIYPYKWNLLNEFCSRGHVVGNHTYSHLNLNDTSCTAFIEDILRCEEIVDSLPTWQRYFRYPYLHRGDTPEKKDSIYRFLYKAKYHIVPVSIYTDDWIYNRDYLRAMERGEDSLLDSIGSAYLDHIFQVSNYFDSLAYRYEHRQIPHILLLHMNFINSLYLDTIINWYEQNNWEFIPVSRALQDSFYWKENTFIGGTGYYHLVPLLPGEASKR